MAYTVRIRETGSVLTVTYDTLEGAIGGAVFGAHHGAGPHAEVIDTEQEANDGLVCTAVGDDAGVVTVTFAEDL